MNKEQPLVSVLMTAYNREKYIAAAIESVLKSTFTNFELIIVDDTSSDASVDLAMSYAGKDSRVKVFVNEKNLGDYPNRNHAASLAKGKYIKYLDSDDIMYPHCLQVMVQCMETFPNAGYGLCANFDVRYPYPVELDPKSAYQEHFYGFGHFNRAPGSSIICRKAFEDVGGFSGKRMIGDMEMWFRLSRRFPMVKMPIGLVWNRLHEEQESQSDYARLYSLLIREVVNDALKDPDCPLSEQEKGDIKRMYKKENIKNKVKNLFFLK